jgi:hypothetical protein
MQGVLAGMTVLANSRSLAADNFENFRISADAFVREFPGNPVISVGDANGRHLFNSAIPEGRPLPHASSGRSAMPSTRPASRPFRRCSAVRSPERKS